MTYGKCAKEILRRFSKSDSVTSKMFKDKMFENFDTIWLWTVNKWLKKEVWTEGEWQEMYNNPSVIRPNLPSYKTKIIC